MLNIGFGSKNELERKLSNFNPLPFVFDDVACACLEGPLQAFKCPDMAEQIRICGLSGREAKRAGRAYNIWQDTQQLSWKNQTFARDSQVYQDILDKLFTAAFAASTEFRDTLRATGTERLVHTIGLHDSTKTVLTVSELTSRHYMLRGKC